MSKLTKFFNHPRAFFRDAITNAQIKYLGDKENPDAVMTETTTAIEKTRSAHERKAKGKKNIELEQPMPSWFRSYAGVELQAALTKDKPVFLYIPWIAEHSNALMSRIQSADDYTLAPFDIANGISDNVIRRDVGRYARENPHVYRRLVIRRLVPLRNQIKAVIFTFDWAPVMHIIANVCEELEIPRILIPHESVFVDREKYYWCPASQASIPVADVILGWGELQKDIFLERGYPADRFISMGAPKFDTYYNYQPQLNREQFYRLFGLQYGKKTILFAAQPLDSQLDEAQAQIAQQNAIEDLANFAEQNDHQLIVRLPPSGHNILDADMKDRFEQSANLSIDDAGIYMVSPEEALYHSDIVASVNSTMLFEGVLMGRPAVSLKYIEFDQIWDQVGIPSVKNKRELSPLLTLWLSTGHNWKPSDKGLLWAEKMFSNGKFDGRAAERISKWLKSFSSKENRFAMRPNALGRMLAGTKDCIDVIGITSTEETLEGIQQYLLPLLNARKVVRSHRGLAEITTIASVDAFVQWGITESENKNRQSIAQRALGRQRIVVEDGFIRSVDIGLSGEPGLSIILDDITAYYDATQPSRLQQLLESGPSLSEKEALRSRQAIDQIVRSRVSKYNHAPDLQLNIGTPGRKKVLLIDQRFGDQSVASGLADEHTYERMLHDVIRQRSDCDIIIKQHPDAIKGGKSSYFSDDRLKFAHYMENVHPINFDINPYSLFELVEEVYVVTSGMGFEALMAGKTVYCYGAPFYSGWGVTKDKLIILGRTRSRNVEELFHFAYISLSRYFHPDRNTTVEVEELVDYIVDKRQW